MRLNRQLGCSGSPITPNTLSCLASKACLFDLCLCPVCSHTVHVNENEKKNRKNLKIENFEKKERFGDMVERELPTKFGLDPCSGSLRMTDG